MQLVGNSRSSGSAAAGPPELVPFASRAANSRLTYLNYLALNPPHLPLPVYVTLQCQAWPAALLPRNLSLLYHLSHLNPSRAFSSSASPNRDGCIDPYLHLESRRHGRRRTTCIFQASRQHHPRTGGGGFGALRRELRAPPTHTPEMVRPAVSRRD